MAKSMNRGITYEAPFPNITHTLKRIRQRIKLNETPTTYEWLGAQIKFEGLKEASFAIAGLDMLATLKIMQGISHKRDLVIGPYKTAHYFSMFDQVEELETKILRSLDLWSRQHVIQFDRMHCFQSMQFMMRDEEMNVVVNMRSCNFKDNFLMDVYISYWLGSYLALSFEAQMGCTTPKVNVIMNIGSLHIFKEEV